MSKITELITNNPYRILRILRGDNVPKAVNKLQKQLRNDAVPDILLPNLGKIELTEVDIVQAKSLLDKEAEFYANYWFDNLESPEYLAMQKLFEPNPNLQELKNDFAKLDPKWHIFFDEILQKHKEKKKPIKTVKKAVATPKENSKVIPKVEKKWTNIIVSLLVACFCLWLVFASIPSYKSSPSISNNSSLSSLKSSSISSSVSSSVMPVPIGTKYYKGIIDGKSPFIAKLEIAKDGAVSGEYIYTNSNYSGIKITGKWEENKLILSESGATMTLDLNTNTGTWIGNDKNLNVTFEKTTDDPIPFANKVRATETVKVRDTPAGEGTGQKIEKGIVGYYKYSLENPTIADYEGKIVAWQKVYWPSGIESWVADDYLQDVSGKHISVKSKPNPKTTLDKVKCRYNNYIENLDESYECYAYNLNGSRLKLPDTYHRRDNVIVGAKNYIASVYSLYDAELITCSLVIYRVDFDKETVEQVVSELVTENTVLNQKKLLSDYTQKTIIYNLKEINSLNCFEMNERVVPEK